MKERNIFYSRDRKKLLDYFSIEGAVGGNQEWYRNVVMYMGGCAAATACDCCIYFALQKRWRELYPYDVVDLTKEDYIRFGMKMKPYLRPRVGGVKKLSMFIEGFEHYLEDLEEVGEARPVAAAGEKDAVMGRPTLHMEGFPGEHSVEEAADAIKKQIDAGFPVPYLMLRHKNPEYKDFIWHWFLCYGYEEKEDGLWITVATYGEATTFSLKSLWETGCEEKGGLILFTTAV